MVPFLSNNLFINQQNTKKSITTRNEGNKKKTKTVHSTSFQLLAHSLVAAIALTPRTTPFLFN